MGPQLSDPLLRSKNEATDHITNGYDVESVGNGFYYERVRSHASLNKGKKVVDDDDDLPPELHSIHQGTSSFWASTTNMTALLLGMGMLSVPYAVSQGGLLSISLLLLFAFSMSYTGYILGKCLATHPEITTYQDIGAAAFGLKGRALLTICLYTELCATLVGFTISVGDNLTQLFPHAGQSLSWVHLEPSKFLVLVAMLVMLPTVLVRDLSYISLFSFGGVVSSIVIVGAVAWTGLFEGVGFSQAVSLFQVANIPVVAGLYAFCYSGHVIIPQIYTSMKDPREFPKVLAVSFTVATTIYGGLGLMGAFMFGAETISQITLNIPTNLTVATIALWTTVITPLCKYSLGIAPIATELESHLPFPEGSWIHLFCGSLIRIAFLLAIVAVAIALPFFGYMLSLIGSAVSISMSITFPCLLYLKMFWSSATTTQIQLNVVLIAIGGMFAIVGTKSSLEGLIESLQG